MEPKRKGPRKHYSPQNIHGAGGAPTKPHNFSIPSNFHDGKTESPRIHWTGLAILEEYWMSEDVDLSGVLDISRKDMRHHQPANRTAQKSESRSVESNNSFSSSTSCASATADQPTVTIPHPNLEHNAHASRIQEETIHQQHDTLVQVPDAVFFEQDFSFSGDDSAMMFEDLYPGSGGSGYPDQFIGSSDPERYCGPWTMEDEHKLAEMLAKYSHGRGLTS